MLRYDPQPYGESSLGPESAGLPPESMIQPAREEKSSFSAEQIKQQAIQKRDEVTEAVKSRASGFLKEQKSILADTIQDVCSATRKCGQELQQNHPQIGQYTNMLADQMENFSQNLRRRDPNYLMEATQSLARRHPGLFLGGALALGFVAVRFLKSSSQVQQITSKEPVASTQPESFVAGMHETGKAPGAQYTV